MKIKLGDLKRIIREEISQLNELGEITNPSPFTAGTLSSQSLVTGQIFYTQRYEFINAKGIPFETTIEVLVNKNNETDDKIDYDSGIMSVAFLPIGMSYSTALNDGNWRNTMSTVASIVIDFYEEHKDHLKLKGASFEAAGTPKEKRQKEMMYDAYITTNMDVIKKEKYYDALIIYYFNNEYTKNMPRS